MATSTRIGDLVLMIDDGRAQAPYAQLVRQVVEGIGDGRLPGGTRLPSVRSLAESLGLAVNTVAKAYRQLEAEGHVETRGRNGTVVLGDASSPLDQRVEGLVTAARDAGLDLDALLGLVRRHW